MKNIKKLWLIAIIVLIGFIAVSCEEELGTFTVTFDSDGGTSVPSQTVEAGGFRPTRPANPSKAFTPTVAGLYEGSTLSYTFVEWRKPNGTAWIFDMDTVSSDITLKAHWTAPAPISGVEANDLQAAVAHANTNNTRSFTMFIDQDINSGSVFLNAEGANLTIIGIGEERTIQYNGNVGWQLITLGSFFTTSNFTLGNNITLRGITNATSRLIDIDAGRLTMKAGSKITGHSTTFRIGAVSISGANARLIIEGGEISGNRSRNMDVGDGAVGGVSVSNGGHFTMTSGTLSGNMRQTLNLAADLWVGTGANVSITGGTLGFRVDQ